MSLNKTKTDAELGKKVQQYLIQQGVETPMQEQTLNVKERIDKIESHFVEIMNALALDLSDDSLAETPRRVAKMYVSEIFYGLDYEAFPKCTTIENKFNANEMVLVKDIDLYSQCEHHILPIISGSSSGRGGISVAYIPKNKVIGLSKLNRVAEFFCKRPQVQERLTLQIFHALQYILETDDVAVLINGRHLCVESRGVEDTSSSTITSKLSGAFSNDPATRAEFMSLVK
ncbi:GTP cyclohydrolase 1 [Pseudomonas phage vB_PaeM_MIJ3]|nr:GTP cyclohydrolase 1 [Pseudomonas phage Callisto]VOH54050.1 GTP cyclohydrolase 1 [Pseudomonas phage vB_PaeM_MIJ3]